MERSVSQRGDEKRAKQNNSGRTEHEHTIRL
jgi:hypothetical protein